MIQVVKRDNAVDPLNADQLRGCLWRVMAPFGSPFARTHHLSRAIVLYLHKKSINSVTSRALFEMVVRALRQTRHAAAADALETHHRWRSDARRHLTVVHDNGQRTGWDRTWLVQQIQRRWDVSRPAARALSAGVEIDLLGGAGDVGRQRVLDLADERIENYGLAPWCLMASAPIR